MMLKEPDELPMPGIMVTSEPARPVAGFFGKLPGRGDFVSRHLPKSFLDPWDAWLQDAMVQSRAQLGESWRECYCTSPIWRFALCAGLCGPAAYAGILMPSVDRVGRYYPLAISVSLEPDWPLLALPATADTWFRHAEQLALAGLELDRLDLDDFSRQVEDLGTPPTPEFLPDDGVASNAWYCPLPEALEFARLPPALASNLLRRGFPRHSLWWTDGSDRIVRCLLLCDGLPPASGFAALLAGDWQQWGWNEKRLAGIASHPGGPPAAEESSS